MSRFALLLILCLVSPPSIAAQEPDSQKRFLQLALNEALSPTNALDEPGYILRIVQNDGVLYQADSGAADIEQARHITDETVFHIATLSKLNTGAA